MTIRIITIKMNAPEAITDQALADRVQRIMVRSSMPDPKSETDLKMIWPDAKSIETVVCTLVEDK